MPKCSIIIPLFNQVEYTQKCLASIVAHTDFDQYEVILVDNGSTDATAQLLDQISGDVTIIRNERNRGFAEACNQGAQAANTATLVFMNNDVEVLPGWLDPLLDTLSAEDRVAAVGGKLLFPDGSLQHGGVVIVWDERKKILHGEHRYRGGSADRPEVNICQFVSAVTAALMAIERTAFEEVGGFDTGYWNGNEDVDLCLSLWASGRAVVYQPGSTAVHHESASGEERWAKEDDNIRRLTARWQSRVQAETVIDDTGHAYRLREIVAIDPDPIDSSTGSEGSFTGDQLIALVEGLAAGSDPALAEAIRSRVAAVEERRLLGVVRAGRDLCWLDEDDPAPLVTIAIPTYNRGQLIVDRAIRSALAQTYRNIEILVVGDRCDRATEEAVRSVEDPRIRFVNLPARGLYPEDPMHRWMVAGSASANAATLLARGAWLTQCDDDDELTPDHVEVLLAAARVQRVELIFSKAKMEVAPGTWAEIGSEPIRYAQITHGSVLYSLGLRHFCYSNTSWLLEEPTDWNMWRRMRDAGVRIGFLPSVTYVHYLETHKREDFDNAPSLPAAEPLRRPERDQPRPSVDRGDPPDARRSPAATPPNLAVEIGRLLNRVPADFGGGCSQYKAEVMAGLVVHHNLRSAIDLGVYRGRSLLPLAAAFRWLGSGQAIGIDPYSAAAALQSDDHGMGEVLVDWAQAQDWDGLYWGVQNLLVEEGLTSVARLIRERSEEAVHQFGPGTVDLVHIDGNHDGDAVADDLRLYRPLVRPGGFIVLDDASWASVRPVYEELRLRATLVTERYSDSDDFAVFQLENVGGGDHSDGAATPPSVAGLGAFTTARP